jgi:hypothetical protein
MNRNNKKKHALIILSHLKDSNGELDDETLARIELGIELFRSKEFDFIVTSGWDYQDDSDLKIGEVVADNLRERYSIEKSKVLIDVCSRDTVGDAFFLRKNVVRPYDISSITVVTTSYHVQRADEVFKKFFSPSVSVVTVGAKFALDNLEERLVNEEKSYRAFLATFENVDISNDTAVFSALSLRHPFYNGKVYEKLNAF